MFHVKHAGGRRNFLLFSDTVMGSLKQQESRGIAAPAFSVGNE